MPFSKQILVGSVCIARSAEPGFGDALFANCSRSVLKFPMRIGNALMVFRGASNPMIRQSWRGELFEMRKSVAIGSTPDSPRRNESVAAAMRSSANVPTSSRCTAAPRPWRKSLRRTGAFPFTCRRRCAGRRRAVFSDQHQSKETRAGRSQPVLKTSFRIRSGHGLERLQWPHLDPRRRRLRLHIQEWKSVGGRIGSIMERSVGICRTLAAGKPLMQPARMDSSSDHRLKHACQYS